MATGALGIEREERGEVDLGGGEAQRRARGGKWASGERARGARGVESLSTEAPTARWVRRGHDLGAHGVG